MEKVQVVDSKNMPRIAIAVGRNSIKGSLFHKDILKLNKIKLNITFEK